MHSFLQFLPATLLAVSFLPNALAQPSSLRKKCLPRPGSNSIQQTTTDPPEPSKSTDGGTEPSTEGPPSTTPVSTSKSDACPQLTPADGPVTGSDIQQYLDAHNNFRAMYGAEPLCWNNTLASKAQEWVNNCKFTHSRGKLGPFGENLAAGTGDFGIQDAVDSWTSESSDYDRNYPQPSHFTQVVWKRSKWLGCASQRCSGIFDQSYGLANFIACEYDPPGNYDGEYGPNVAR